MATYSNISTRFVERIEKQEAHSTYKTAFEVVHEGVHVYSTLNIANVFGKRWPQAILQRASAVVGSGA